MNLHKYILALLMVWTVIPANAELDKNTVSWLDKLDASLAKRSYFEKQRIDRIEGLKKDLKKATTDDQRYGLMYSLYNEYKSYRYDSARHYSYACLDLATRQHKSQNIAQSKLAIAFSLISAGILREANDVIATINTAVNSAIIEYVYLDVVIILLIIEGTIPNKVSINININANFINVDIISFLFILILLIIILSYLKKNRDISLLFFYWLPE